MMTNSETSAFPSKNSSFNLKIKNLTSILAVLVIFLYTMSGYGQTFPLRINTGGAAATGADGNAYEADNSSYYTSGTSTTTRNVDGLVAPYNTIRYAPGETMTYTILVPDGNYDVMLHFAETWFGTTGGGSAGVGQRIFDVNVQGGALEINDLDIYAINNAAVIAHVVEVNDVNVTTGALTIYFTSQSTDGGVQHPQINAIEIFEATVSNPAPTNPDFAVRINSGGPAIIHEGKQFDADQYFVGGTPYTNSSAEISALYLTEHSGSARTFDYNIPVANGNYDITLHFAEIYWGATGGGIGEAGKRVFDVNIEGNNVMDNYDIYTDVGPQTPSIKNFTVTVTDEELNINFISTSAVGGIDQGKVSAIEVVSATSSSGGSSLWTKSTTNTNSIYYNTGNIGIGVTNPDSPLTVNGQIHTTEVKVDMLGSLVPDYVFLKDYDLKTLEEVEKAIQELGHLPKIPSAQEMEENGMELKTMNLSLLEKIEELTLYIIQQNKAQKQLEERIHVLETQK